MLVGGVGNIRMKVSELDARGWGEEDQVAGEWQG